MIHLFGEYRDHIVVVGGWVPDLLLGNKKTPHVGSMDVDLALDHRNLRDDGYKTIRKLLLDRGYVEGKQSFVFETLDQILTVESKPKKIGYTAKEKQKKYGKRARMN